MSCRYDQLRRHPTVFLKMTGLRLAEFDQLLTDMLPRIADAERARLARANRQRVIAHAIAVTGRRCCANMPT